MRPIHIGYHTGAFRMPVKDAYNRGMDTFETADLMYGTVADVFCELVQSKTASGEVFNLSLSGGSTPRRLYEQLAQRDLPWDQIHWFWGDERNVSHEDGESNFRMVREAWLDPIDAPTSNVHPVPVNTSDPAEAARAYEQTLREHFRGETFPRWDLALLGMGDDAHTASLFPNTQALTERERWFVENWVEKFESFRYTLTVPAINSARQCWFLIAGAGKRSALADVRGPQRHPERYPSQLIEPTRWFVTRDAVA